LLLIVQDATGVVLDTEKAKYSKLQDIQQQAAGLK
jgi:hypothetical protein